MPVGVNTASSLSEGEVSVRADSKQRPGAGGRHVSPLTQPSRARSGKIARCFQRQKKNRGRAGGGEPMKTCVYLFQGLGKKAFDFKLRVHPKVWGRGGRGVGEGGARSRLPA